MVGPTDVCSPPVPRAARARDACLWHVSSVGGSRRRGCAAGGVAEFLDGLLGGDGARGVVVDLDETQVVRGDLVGRLVARQRLVEEALQGVPPDRAADGETDE